MRRYQPWDLGFFQLWFHIGLVGCRVSLQLSSYRGCPFPHRCGWKFVTGSHWGWSRQWDGLFLGHHWDNPCGRHFAEILVQYGLPKPPKTFMRFGIMLFTCAQSRQNLESLGVLVLTPGWRCCPWGADEVRFSRRKKPVQPQRRSFAARNGNSVEVVSTLPGLLGS